MFADVVGYSAISSVDEARALRILEELGEKLKPIFMNLGGKVIKTMGDGYLVEFASAVQAVKCALEVQKTIGSFPDRPGERVSIRIGIHVGDVVHSGGDLLGDAVNVAARVEPLAEPGGICVTRQVVDQVQRKVEFEMTSLGFRDLKNISYPVEVFKMEPSNFRGTAASALDTRRLAVLPFSNMSPDPNDKYFADGMTEELISTVSKIRELQVISRTSVMRYRDGTAQVGQIGRELSVGSIIEGSVRKAGNRVRITAQLIEVDGDRHVWSQSYERDLTDVFAVQADIAEQVAGSLKVQLLSAEKRSIRKEATTNPEAHTLYLKGRYHWGERTEENTRKALRYFEEATKVDPGYAIAYSGMADAYSILSDYGWMDPKEALPLAMLYAKKALELDDDLAEAHGSLGLVLSNYKWDLGGAEKELKRAIELKPNYTPALHWYSVNLFYMRRYKEAFDTDMKALALDPYSRLLNMTSTNERLLFPDRYEEAIKRYGELIQEHPDMSALRYWRAIAYVLTRAKKEAIKDAEENVRMEGGVWTSTYSPTLHLAWVHASLGNKEEAEKLIRTAITMREKRSVSATTIGWVKVMLGDEEDGYRWLQKAFDEEDPALLYFNGFPWSKSVRADPRWKEIEAKFPFKSVED
jgi:TolB-like protein/Tfp pilus assembly protein PilF